MRTLCLALLLSAAPAIAAADRCADEATRTADALETKPTPSDDETLAIIDDALSGCADDEWRKTLTKRPALQERLERIAKPLHLQSRQLREVSSFERAELLLESAHRAAPFNEAIARELEFLRALSGYVAGLRHLRRDRVGFAKEWRRVVTEVGDKYGIAAQEDLGRALLLDATRSGNELYHRNLGDFPIVPPKT